MENIVILVEFVVLAVTARFALRSWRRMRVLQYQRILQRAAIGMCADVMADERQGKAAREYAARLSVMFMSERVLDMFSKGPSHVRKLLGAQTGERASARLTEGERKTLFPAIEAFALSAMLYDEKYGHQICKTFDSEISEAYRRAKSVKAVVVSEEPRSEPVKRRLQTIEELIEREAALSV